MAKRVPILYKLHNDKWRVSFRDPARIAEENAEYLVDIGYEPIVLPDPTNGTHVMILRQWSTTVHRDVMFEDWEGMIGDWFYIEGLELYK